MTQLTVTLIQAFAELAERKKTGKRGEDLALKREPKVFTAGLRFKIIL